MKLFFALLMVVFGQSSYAFELNCKSTSGLTLKANLEGAAIEAFTLTFNGTPIAESKRFLAPTKSYDMIQSQNFTDNLPYWSYSLKADQNCSYQLSLPEEDLRDYSFVALVHTWGKQCRSQEVELVCN